MMQLFLLILASSSTDDLVQRAVDSAAPPFQACFAGKEIDSAHVVLRFRVDAEGRATGMRAEEADPADDDVTRCLIAALESVPFPTEAAGADVAYPIRFHREVEPSEPAREVAKVEVALKVVNRDNLFGHRWIVADAKRGVMLSDLELARMAGEPALHADLESTQSRFLTLAVIEGLVAGAGFGVGAWGAVQGFGTDEPGHPTGGETAMMLSGAAVAVTAGLLSLYHLIRFSDISATGPMWHQFDRVRAEELAAQANRR